MKTITTVNPATNSDLKTYTLLTNEEVNQAIDASDMAFHSWRKTSFEERARIMLKTADLLEQNSSRYAVTMTEEMGKTLSSAKAEVEKCAWVCRYYAEHAESFLASEEIKTDATKSYISYQPLGTVLAVMPWNYPFWQVFRFVAPALMAGNTGLLKHASNVVGCGILIEEVLKEAGLPDGVFTFLPISSKQVEPILRNPKVKAATLTGSEAAGAAVASTAAEEIKKSVLELGGSDPYIVLHDADIDLAAAQCATSRLLNSGQSCIGAKRFIIVKDVYDEFLEKFTAEMKAATYGNPKSEATDIGPMARVDLRDELHEQVIASVNAGAHIHLGGFIPDMEGAYYPPTILTHVAPGMPAYEDELFGPVASVIKVNNENEAIKVANDTSFGLGACVFSKDIERAERIAREELEAGCCFVNQFVKSDPRLPFGGIKQSGFGRELSHYGIKEFVNIKTVYLMDK